MSVNKEKYRFWQHSNGTIYIVWTEHDATTQTGMQTKRVSTGTTDWESAEQYRAQFIAGLNNPAPPKEPTIGYLLERYWDERGQHTRSPETIQRAFKKLMPFFGQLLPSHVSNQLFRKFAEEHIRIEPLVLSLSAPHHHYCRSIDRINSGLATTKAIPITKSNLYI